MQTKNSTQDSQKDNEKNQEEIKKITIRLEKLESVVNDLIKENEKLSEDNNNYKLRLEKLEKTTEEQENKLNKLEKKNNKSEGEETEEPINKTNIHKFIKPNGSETINFMKNPLSLNYSKSITANKNKDCLSEYILYNSFKDGNQYLISANKDTYNLDVYDLNNGKLINSLKGHDNRIDHLRYFSNNNKSYIISSDTNHTVIVWDDNFRILNKINTGLKGSIISSYLLFHKNEKDYFIIIPSTEINEYTKIYDNAGRFIKDIYNTNNNITFHLDCWNYNNNHYLIEASFQKVSVCNLFKDELYHEFIYNPESCHFTGIIYKQNYYITNTSDDNLDNSIRIYDLINKNIYKIIEVKNHQIGGICLWNDKYLLLCNNGLIHKKLEIFNIETSKIEKSIIDGNVKILEAKTIKLKNNTESLVVADNENAYKIYSIKE